MTKRYLNLGCGPRYHADPHWENVDYHARSKCVRAVDLNQPLPYKEGTFDFIYTSHVLDHFTLARVRSLLGEIRQCLIVGGVLRISVPDLAHAAEAYLASLRANRHDLLKHQWFTIQLIDQMARSEPGGEKVRFLRAAHGLPGIRAWLRPLLSLEMGRHLEKALPPPTARGRLKAWVRSRILRRRFEDTGERHLWMFDEIALEALLRQAGFGQIARVSWDTSLSAEYLRENLDVNDGTEHKPNSLYMEARK